MPRSEMAIRMIVSGQRHRAIDVVGSILTKVGFGRTADDSVIAQSYPTRAVTIILPFPSGGPDEFVFRLVTDGLSCALGQSVIIQHHPGGASGTVGAMAVVSADPDGYTLFWSSPSPMITAPAVYKNLGYDPVKSLAPIAMTFSAPQVLTINSRIPVKSVRELVAHAKANPGKINFASPGYGTQPHLLGEMFKSMAGIDIVHVPYSSPAAAIADLLAGQVQMYFETAPIVLSHIEAGKLKALAVAAKTPLPQLPDTPTAPRVGYPRLLATYWSGILAPAGTPAHIVNKLNAAINEIMKSHEVEAGLATVGGEALTGSPKDFAAHIAAETQKWAAVARSAGVQAE
jgi:tripartite-type tricarboxylate transporter receptor subunit TctC